MTKPEIVARFLVRFKTSGFPPFHGHNSAKHKDAVVSQPGEALYIDCGMDMDLTEAILSFCAKQGWIVAPFGLSLGLGINQPTFEATQKGLDVAEKLLEAINS